MKLGCVIIFLLNLGILTSKLATNSTNNSDPFSNISNIEKKKSKRWTVKNKPILKRLKLPLVGDFHFNLKYGGKKDFDDGWILIGLTPDKIDKNQASKWYCESSIKAWGITNNKFLCEKGEWTYYEKSKFELDSSIDIKRENGIVTFLIDDKPNSYGRELKYPVFLTVQLTRKDDYVQLISGSINGKSLELSKDDFVNGSKTSDDDLPLIIPIADTSGEVSSLYIDGLPEIINLQ